MRPIIDAFLLSYKREEYLEAVVRGIRRQSMVRDIYVFHNSPSTTKINGVFNIISEKNFGCFARHVFALMTDSEFAFFIDDDIELLNDYSDLFYKAIKISSDSIIGVYGNNINLKDKDKPYSNGNKMRFSESYRFVDIVLGRIHLCKKKRLLNAVEFVKENQGKVNGMEYNTFIEDDIVLNLAAQLKTNIPSLLVPFKYDDMKNLTNKNSISSKDFHYKNRDKLINSFKNKGWKSSIRKTKFENQNLERCLEIYKKEKYIKYFDELLKQKKFSLLKTELAEGIEVLPRLTLYNLAGLFMKEYETQLAEKIYKKLLAINCDNEHVNLHGLTLFKLGMIYENKGNATKAKEYFYRCVEIMPEHNACNEKINEYREKGI